MSRRNASDPRGRLVARGASAGARSAGAPRRRGAVLIAVIVITAAMLLVVAGMVDRSAAERVATSGGTARTQRSLAASAAVRVVAEALADGRDAILEGEDPAPPASEIVLWEAGGDEWIARPLPIGPAGERMAPEAARIDLAAVTADQLVASGLVEPASAEAIVRAVRRGGGGGPGLAAIGLLAADPQLDPEVILGPLDEIRITDAARGDEAELGDRILDRLGGGGPSAVADLLTVHAVEPSIQRDGRTRIVLRGPWSEELGERLDERFGEGTGALVRTLMEGEGLAFDRDASIVEQLVRFDVPLADWGDYLDALTSVTGSEVRGRLDLNRASAAALRTLPGIDEETALALVDARDGLDSEARSTIAWPVAEGIIEPGAFAALADRLTVRSFTWRVRVASGRRPAGSDPDVPLTDVTVLEAVVDLAAPRPRIAELRDVSTLQLAARLVLEASGGDLAAEAGPDGEFDPGDGADAASSDDAASGDESFGTGFDAFFGPAFAGAGDPGDGGGGAGGSGDSGFGPGFEPGGFGGPGDAGAGDASDPESMSAAEDRPGDPGAGDRSPGSGGGGAAAPRPRQARWIGPS